MKYDYLIVGAGLYGATFARLARDAGRRVLVIDKRPHVGGNAYTERICDIEVHRYGAHIFHTSDERVWGFINRFARFNGFINSPMANYRGEMYSLPFNMLTFNKMWGARTPAEAMRMIEEQRARSGIGEPKNLEEQAIGLVGYDIYEKLIRGYTVKQWGMPCSALPAFIIRRLPIRFTYDNNYYRAAHQGIPTEGYTKMVESMLDGVEVRLGVDYLRERASLRNIAKRTVYTGPIDAYFDYRYGALGYRSLRFETEVINTDNYQGCAVINYTDEEVPYTRVIEHKHFTFGTQEVSVISREYSIEWTPEREPYYPINDPMNNALCEKYKALAMGERDVIFGGRLGEYRYCDMDETVAAAMNAVESESL